MQLLHEDGRACGRRMTSGLRRIYSQCLRLSNHLFPKLDGQGTWREHVNRHCEQLRQFQLNFGDVHHCGFAGGLYQQVEVTLLGVVAMHHRTEHPNVGHAVAQGNAANGFAVGLQCFGWSHPGFYLSEKGPFGPFLYRNVNRSGRRLVLLFFCELDGHCIAEFNAPKTSASAQFFVIELPPQAIENCVIDKNCTVIGEHVSELLAICSVPLLIM